MLLCRDKLLEELHNNAIIVTPNNRLSKQLLNDFADKYLHKSASAIEKPVCLPYQNFLQYLYKEIQHQNPYIEHPILLNSAQERYLWLQVFNSSQITNINLNLVKHVQEAWNRCRIWQVDIKNPEFSQTWQGKISQSLQQQFQQELDKTNTITQANLVNYLINYYVFSHKKVIWACFDDYTPAQILLQQHLQNHNNEICHFDLQNMQANSQKYRAQDKQDEYSTMLTWLDNRLAENDKNIAIVLPNIAEHGDYVASLIQKKFPKETINISLGQSLIKHLLIAHALRFIRFDNNISNWEARLILNSPYIANSQTEFKQRAELLQNLQILKKPSLTIKDLAQECAQSAPRLADILTNLSQYPENASPSEWISIFQKRLQEFGFPGEYTLSSITFQCFNRLQNLFAEFMQFAIFCQNMPKKTTLNTLYDLANENIFQPKQDPSKISILGLLEASGCTFDSIWVSDLTDKCLPGKTNFSAFIPIEMQKRLLMPHSSNERELKFAKQQLQRLQSSCKNIIFSYPSFVDDIPMLPSPLILNLKEMPKITNIHKPHKTNLVNYNQDYTIAQQDLTNIKGGTSLLANQAKCPFMAFAKNRLYATPANDVYDWPNNLDRGQILHKILEEFWNIINNRKKLIELTESEIDDLINNISETVINNNQTAINNELQTLIKQGELKRYNALIKSALKWELSRPDFQVIATEKSYTFNLGEINLKIRVDRIDQLITKINNI